jgi:hypothetical protein
MTHRDQGATVQSRRAGITRWQARQDLEDARNRQLIAVVLLAVLAVMWCGIWFTATTEDQVVSVWLIFELITIVPLTFGARRVVRLSALIARADAYADEDQAAEAEALRATDETMWHLGELVASLEDGPAREEARDAVVAAERAAAVLRPLVRRRTLLEHLLDDSRSRSATVTLRATLAACQSDIVRLDTTIAELGASVASLVDAASDFAFERDLENLRQSTADVEALVDAFQDIAAVEGVAHPRGGARRS